MAASPAPTRTSRFQRFVLTRPAASARWAQVPDAALSMLLLTEALLIVLKEQARFSQHRSCLTLPEVVRGTVPVTTNSRFADGAAKGHVQADDTPARSERE